MEKGYSLTVKFAPYGTEYLEEDGSISRSIGHVWYEIRKPGVQQPESFGWSTGDDKNKGGEDNLKREDWFRYRGKNINFITVEISKDQYDKLMKFPSEAISGRVHGFSKNYDLITNSCIDFAGKALGAANLAHSDFDGKAASPYNQLGTFLEQIAKNRNKDATLEVLYKGEKYVFGANERDIKKFKETFDLAQSIGLEKFDINHQTQYVQTAPELKFTDMPPLVQELCQKCQAKLEAYYQKHNIHYSQDGLERAALAAGVAAYGEKMTDLTMLNIKDGNIYVGHKTPQGVLNYASVNEQTAAATPEQDSIAQSKQAERDLALAAEQRRQEILAYQQSQSMGRSI